MNRQLTDEQIQRNIAWAEALESDQYKQGTRCLRSLNDEFCCLGVACDLYFEATGDGSWDKHNEDSNYYFQGRDGFPSEEVRRWFGWESDAPTLEVEGRKEFATIHNDKFNCTFKEIARGVRKLVE